MARLLFGLVLLCASDWVSLISAAAADPIVDFQPYEETWKDFKDKYDRHYTGQEETTRYKAFVARLKKIEAHNRNFLANRESYTMGIGPLTDRTDNDPVGSCAFPEDTISVHRRKRQTELTCQTFTKPDQFSPPKSLDWRDKGAVTPVKNQGKCGSCYAFGMTATIEAQLKFATGSLVSLSEQQIVDCGARGCKGGNFTATAFYVERNGIMSEADFPYRNKTAENGTVGNCTEYYTPSKVLTNITGCLKSRANETDLKYMVASQGPVWVGIRVVDSIHDYNYGVYSVRNCASNRSHCLTVVGYGHDEKCGKDYWIAKNSWGAKWGCNDGYIWVERGKNTCGIAAYAYVPIIGGKKDRGIQFASGTASMVPSVMLMLLCLSLKDGILY